MNLGPLEQQGRASPAECPDLRDLHNIAGNLHFLISRIGGVICLFYFLFCFSKQVPLVLALHDSIQAHQSNSLGDPALHKQLCLDVSTTG